MLYNEGGFAHRNGCRRKVSLFSVLWPKVLGHRDVGSIQIVGGHMHSGTPSTGKMVPCMVKRGTLHTKFVKK